MANVSRRDFLAVGAGVVSSVGLGADTKNQFLTPAPAKQESGGGSGGRKAKVRGIQGIFAVCEVTGGGQKVYGIAVEYDVDIDPGSLADNTYSTRVVPAARGFFPGMPNAPDKNVTTEAPEQRAVAAIYTNAQPALRSDRASVAGVYVIAEFQHDSDLSLPTTDSDKVALKQEKSVRTSSGEVYATSETIWSNAGQRGNSAVIRGVDAWEQNHWWWDDTRSAWLEYSVFLPKSFLEEGGENASYPLILAITHSGTSYDGTCAQTLTEQCIASIWSMPEEQDRHECVIVTPRYERTTMNDYWEHTSDVENTYSLVKSLLQNTWNYGNPNLPDRMDKVLRIDPKRVYCTGWSMGAMTSLWLMARHPETFAAGLIIAGQQRPGDVVTLADQKLLIITGSEDGKATPWNEKCVPVWEKVGARVTRPAERLDPSLIFPVDDQRKLTAQVDRYLAEGGNITFLTFDGVDHMGSARKFFYIKAARDWLLTQAKG
ncbi:MULTISPECIES: alpha/beta hydrolase-fold protein [unclassified Rhizobium]|uniref:alpha/beta hydrolase-fold protein n=1 Tax=unclassified Rhizobium TaxID=2613769 RepID=UPI001ADC6737|nr:MULTISPECIES: prolyl oligopeptidase family serine peptidase [unclassified Rhizobium]MBO9096856.1 prolyl oligopeptidase family serine peptidase [Rhizobium sp. L58/93]MBO9172450.1 prolyl oligopeptidase family serine peptidase [Rhizobium sp. L245/93]QXZ88229.1 prolyl oligopeptidase family serine peptidase [Rhizobium sp. K1/93]QXZ94200.1 prolyl oligopeptidase family serine peptidase [Rhizobium sp. K15/93]QYA05702.1 prolyl oligopeptidase family serine peptidase [Rhizobium sp. B21/90]